MKYILKNKKTGYYFSLSSSDRDIKYIDNAYVFDGYVFIFDRIKGDYDLINYNNELRKLRKEKLKKLNSI